MDWRISRSDTTPQWHTIITLSHDLARRRNRLASDM